MRPFPCIASFSILPALLVFLYCLQICNGESKGFNSEKLRLLSATGPHTSDRINESVEVTKTDGNSYHWLSKSSIDKFSNILGFENMTSLEDIISEMEKDRGTVLLSLKNYIEFATLEEKLVKILTKRLGILVDEMNLIKSYLSDYEDSSGQAILNARGSTDTPDERGRIIGKSSVLGHRMTHRYATELTQLRKLYNSMEHKESENELTKTVIPDESQPWVYPEDLFLSMTAFAHLQEVFMYQPEKLQKGLEIDTQAGGELKSIHCAEMGMFALHQSRYVMSVEWLELANSLSLSEPHLRNEEDNYGIPHDLSKLLARFAAQAHNSARRSLISLTLYESPLTAHTSPQTRTTTQKREFLRNRGFSTESRTAEAMAQFSEICMGNSLQPPELTKDLKCFYEKKRDPYFYISPVKTEQLSKTPPALQFYNIIGDKTNSEIQGRFEKLMKLNEGYDHTGSYFVSQSRTSAGVDLFPEFVPKKIYSLAQSLTGFQVLNNTDMTQYVEYTYGKFNQPHFDYYQSGENAVAQKLLEKNGDRLATMIYYLEVPELGGETPFCQGGIRAHPVRNSAILWVNLYRNGTARKDAMHGSCPVGHGNKIIMTNWIYYWGNFERFKCTLNQYE